MKTPRALPLALGFLALFSLSLSCATTGGAPGDMPPAAAPAKPPAPVAKVAAQEPEPAAPVVPERPPPARVTAALAGEPVAALREARLETTSCDDYWEVARKQALIRVRTMRAEVDASLQSWVDSQPSCWQEYQWQEEQNRRYAPRAPSKSADMGAAVAGGSVSLPSAPRAMATSAPARPGAVGSAGSSAPRKADSASGTNNQVVGVDEADIVKTDGRYVYLAMNGALRIVEALNPHVVSVTRIPGSVRELFVEGDRAVVFSASGGSDRRCTYGYDCQFAGDGSATKITVLDIRDRAAPRPVRTIDLSGSLMASRRIGTTVHTVVADGDAPGRGYATWPDDVGTCGYKEAFVRRRFAELKRENERKILAETWVPTIRENGVDKPLCNTMLRTGIPDGQAFTTVVSFDLRADGTPATTATLQSRPGAVFASANTLYLSVTHQKSAAAGKWYSFYPSVDEVSEIHAFRIGEAPGETRYLGSGVVPGHVLNQFAMDEWYGYLRVATTRGKVPDPRVNSVISVLAPSENGNLVRVGAVEGIAPGEDIRAVRFDGDRGYIVTFKKTDPLFVLDLYQPDRPVILGELKIPGFSTYMHRIDPGHLLSIGFDADDKGDFAYFDGVILQLFDVTNPTDPRLLHKEKIGTRGSSSEAATNHLAFNYFPERGMLALPMTICEGGGDGRNGNELTFSGLLVYDVSLTKGFTRLGGVDHGQRGANCSVWWSRAESQVKRSVFLDDLVYSIATDRVKVQRLGAFGMDVADLALRP
jgi:hypothetical protein